MNMMIKKAVVMICVMMFLFGTRYLNVAASYAYIDLTNEDVAHEVTAYERDILYRIAWAEARGEDDKGVILVINVIFNRMANPQFPDTIQEVVFAPRQFSPITNGAFARAEPCERIKYLVQRALDGADYSYGATFFRMRQGSAGSWHERALDRVLTHGTHHFYVARGGR